MGAAIPVSGAVAGAVGSGCHAPSLTRPSPPEGAAQGNLRVDPDGATRRRPKRWNT
jgi:hypothetical protein